MEDEKPRSKILVVDDSSQNVELLETYLTLSGYEVHKACDGQEALEKVHQVCPDLILLDIMMPRLDGYETCIRLKEDERTRFIPVVMITALREAEDRVKGLEAGADDFLSKPFNRHELLARVKSLLRIKHLHDELERKNSLLSRILNRYVAEEISALVINNPDKYLQLGGECRTVTVLFADIRGFTKFSEHHPPNQVVDILNAVFSELTKVIFRHKGTFDKYLGDSIMAFYGAPVSYEDDVLRAARSALEMQRIFEQMKGEKEILADLGLGIGLSSGDVVVGNIGSEEMMDYTVIGDTANVACRLQEIAGKGQILISQSVYEHIKDQAIVEDMPPQNLRGREEPVICYELKGLR
ncbi:MAG: response regulator [Anaerolineae bacterium]